jgi:hypothetical protein
MRVLAVAVVIPPDPVEEDDTVPVKVPWHLGAAEDVTPVSASGSLHQLQGGRGELRWWEEERREVAFMRRTTSESS